MPESTQIDAVFTRQFQAEVHGPMLASADVVEIR